MSKQRHKNSEIDTNAKSYQIRGKMFSLNDVVRLNSELNPDKKYSLETLIKNKRLLIATVSVLDYQGYDGSFWCKHIVCNSNTAVFAARTWTGTLILLSPIIIIVTVILIAAFGLKK
jgi:hypothetical protein